MLIKRTETMKHDVLERNISKPLAVNTKTYLLNAQAIFIFLLCIR